MEVDGQTGEVGKEIDALAPEADEETRQRLAELLAPTIARNLIDYPWLSDPTQRMSRNRFQTKQTLIAAAVELYNPAQLDVFARARRVIAPPRDHPALSALPPLQKELTERPDQVPQRVRLPGRTDHEKDQCRQRQKTDSLQTSEVALPPILRPHGTGKEPVLTE